jgi:hypothetical protein
MEAVRNDGEGVSAIYHSVFGVRGVPLEWCASELGKLLGLEMAERESDYLGVYFLGAGPDCKIQVLRQPDPEGELLESGYPDCDVIIYVDGISRFDSVEGHLIGGFSIRRLSA